MINFKKVFNIIPIYIIYIIFITIWVVSTSATGVSLSNEIHLRIPLDTEGVQNRIIELYDKQKHKEVTKKRLEELAILVPRLKKELGRDPNMTEVVAQMTTITGKTLQKKVATLSMWMKTNSWVPEQFGIQKFAYTPEPIKVGFNFGGLYFNTPKELESRIITQQTSGVRLELTELVLEGVEKQNIQLRLRLLEKGDFELQCGDKKDIIKRPVDRTYISIDTLLSTPAFIAFRDSILGIPVEFGIDRKIAMLNFLETYGAKDLRGKREVNVYMGNDLFYLPSYYRDHGDRIIVYRDRENYINIVALVDSQNPENLFIFEKRHDDYYSTESGEKLVHSGVFSEARRMYNLPKCADFRNFDEALDKTQKERHYFSFTDERICQVCIGQVTLTFWPNVSISEDTIETQRSYRARDDFTKYPITLKRDDGRGEIIIRSYEGRKDAVTISGLNLSNGKPAILRGSYFNISVILEMIRMGKFEGLVTDDKLLRDTFYYREKPPHSGRFNPIRAYKFDKTNGIIETGDSIHPRDLPIINIETGKIDVPKEDLDAMKSLFSGA